MMDLKKKLDESFSFIEKKFKATPSVGVVLGSGLGDFIKCLSDRISIPFSDIPHFLPPTVEGHTGHLVLGALKGKTVVVLQGRIHYYEGHDIESVVFPIRLLCRLGIKTLLVTNAAGGVNPGFREGDLMVIEDHINFTGLNPLRGKNNNDLGVRFPDMSYAYNKNHRQILKESALKHNIELKKGVYMWLLGPTFETPAEIRAVRILGADAVGMSTVPEVIAARHMGIEVAGLSCITNLAAGMRPEQLNHQEILKTSSKAVQKMFDVMSEAIPLF